MSINVLRAPVGPSDRLSAEQVEEYLCLLSSRDREIFKSNTFAEQARKAFDAVGAAAGGTSQGPALLAALQAALEEMAQLQSALKSEFSNQQALEYIVQAFGRSTNGVCVTRNDFVDFVRFCIAYRIHCYFEPFSSPAATKVNDPRVGAQKKPSVVFVLGGPGAGKGTQCDRIKATFGYTHLSAGDLLREERKRPGSEYGELIESYIKEGKLVPIEITVKLLKQAMEKQGWEGGKFIIDGFPRSMDNMNGWEKVIGESAQVKFCLFFDCPEACMQERLLERGKTSGRSDDNPETIKKRFKTFQEESLPVIGYLEQKGIVRKIPCEQTIEEVWKSVKGVFGPSVVFILGGPGAGKGTQCERIAQSFGYTHLSAGDLLREERKQPGSKYGALIEEHIKEGKLVPAEITVKLMLQEMEKRGWEGGRYLIDGFPRSFGNLEAWRATVGEQVLVKFVIYLHCSNGVMEARLLERGKTSGRADDNIQTIRKRFLTFHNESMPVVEQFAREGMLRQIDSEKDVDTVWGDVQTLFGPTVIFVLGGPGAGKGTQCAKISEYFGYVHLSAGDLLREERKRVGSQYGELIESYIKEGKLVPVEITVKLLKQAMMNNQWEGGKYLVDGFPRSHENLEGWNRELSGKVTVRFSIFFDCTETVMQDRLLERGKTSGRSDDNLESIKKRFRTFQEESLPVRDYMNSRGTLRTIDATQSAEAVWSNVQELFRPTVIFVIGGPGAGKKTQCARIAQQFNYQHLSIGDVLREHAQFDASIADKIKQGVSVPTETVVELLKQQMERRQWEGGRFVIDGFPRNMENMEAWNKTVGSKVIVKMVLFLDCPENMREERVLDRGKKVDRIDDNAETISKRNKAFEEGFTGVAESFAASGLLRKIDATQLEEDVWNCTTEVVGNELAVHVKNSALVILKPHAQGPETERFVQSCLTQQKVAVIQKGTMTAADFVSKGFFDKQYLQIVNNASSDPAALQVPSAGQELFKQAEGVAWGEAVNKGEVFSAIDAVSKLSLNNEELARAWSATRCTRLASSMQVARIQGKGGASGFVVNGFMPFWRESFATGDQQLTWFVVEFSPAQVSWKSFRANILGSTDPSVASKDSMRRQFYDHWQALGLRAQPDTLNNCVHASAGPLEGLRERMLWASAKLDSDSFARLLRSSGVPKKTLQAWLDNGDEYGWRIGLETRSGPVFECTEDCDSKQVRDSATRHLKQQGAALDTWTVTLDLRSSPSKRASSMFAETQDRFLNPGEKATDKMTILHFNDVYNVEPRAKEPVGGVARFVTRIRELKAESIARGEPEAVVLFSGDAFNPSLTSTTTMGKHMIPALNAIGIHTACYGNHDFDFGVDNLVDMANQNNFPWLISNVTFKATGRPLAEGMISRMLHFHGRKIGLIGLVEKEWLVTLATLEPSEVDFEDFCPCARRLARQLKKKQGADIVIALTHMRVPNDELLAHEVPEVDIILGGHDHHYDVKPVGPHGTYVLKSGTDFRDITRMTIDFSTPEGSKSFKVVDTQHAEIVGNIKEDPDMKVFVDDCMAKLSGAMNKLIGRTAVDLDCRFASIRTQETNIGNFVADVMKLALKADLAGINSGTLRADAIIEKGEVKMRDLVNLLPMLDELCLLQLSGTQILAVLENSVSQYPRLEGRFLQVSGVQFTFDADKPGGQRLVEGSVKIGGQPLDLQKQYKFVTKDYLRQGKDGFDVFKECTCLADGELAGILPTLVRDMFQMITALNGETSASDVDATRRATELIERGEPAIQLVGDGPLPTQCYAISPKLEGRIICLNPKM